MWRFGGASKKAKPQIEYIDRERIVERIVEKPVEVIKEVEVVKKVDSFGELFNNIHFDFDKASLTPQSEEVLDEIAKLMKENDSNRYLIIGYTDARGSEAYNLDLSRRRVATVVDALKIRGVPPGIIKSRGVGKKMSYAPASESDKIRKGDRKVSVEIISNQDYWDFISEK